MLPPDPIRDLVAAGVVVVAGVAIHKVGRNTGYEQGRVDQHPASFREGYAEGYADAQ